MKTFRILVLEKHVVETSVKAKDRRAATKIISSGNYEEISNEVYAVDIESIEEVKQ